MGKRDVITISPEAYEVKVVPDDYPFDEQGNPVYDWTKYFRFEGMKKEQLLYLMNEVVSEMLLKWNDAQNRKRTRELGEIEEAE